LEAARAVAVSAEIAAADVDDPIANLVAKSLLTADVSGPVARYRLLDTTRAFAREKLAESGEGQHAARRHAEFYRDVFAPAASRSELQPTIARLALYRREINNVRAALDWAFSPEGDRALGVVLTAAYVPVWLHLSLLTECRDRAERALDNLAPDSDLSLRLKVQLLTSLGVVVVYTTGVVDRTGEVLAKALDVADSTDDADLQLRALYAMWIYQFNRGEHHAAQLLAERFSRVAPRTGDPADLLFADRLMGSTLHYGGNQPDAQRCYERLLDRYSAPTDRRHVMWLHYDGRVLAQTRLARVLWLRGFMDRADQVAQASLADALAMDHKLSVCSALGEAVCPIQLMAGDIAGAERSVAMLTDLATRHSFTVWTRFARCLESKLLIKRGEVASGSVLLRAALDGFNTAGQALHGSGFVGDLAEGLAGAGQLAEASVIVDAALARSDRDGVRWHVAELLRIKGELLLQDAGSRSMPAAEECFLGALEVAQRQSALFWELRAAVSLARLKAQQDRQDEARNVLAPVYDRFTEGFETADLRAAWALLEILPAH
jgi:predicted ATPase